MSRKPKKHGSPDILPDIAREAEERRRKLLIDIEKITKRNVINRLSRRGCHRHGLLLRTRAD